MNINKNDLKLMIKMESLIWQNDKKLFGKNLKKTYKDADGEPITYDNFMDYYNVIDRVIKEYHEYKRKRAEYNKTHKEWHNINNGMADAKRRGKTELYKKWKQELNEYNKKQRIERAKKILKEEGE